MFIDTNTQKSDNNKEYRGHAYCVKIEINSSWELEEFKVVLTPVTLWKLHCFLYGL